MSARRYRKEHDRHAYTFTPAAAVQTPVIPGFSNVTSTVRKIGGVTMKLKIEGHTVVVNKMSIYIDGKMEFQAVNMITEYGQKLNGCKYAVASRYNSLQICSRG